MLELPEGLFIYLDVLAEVLDKPVELLERFNDEVVALVDIDTDEIVAWEYNSVRQYLLSNPPLDCPRLLQLFSHELPVI